MLNCFTVALDIMCRGIYNFVCFACLDISMFMFFMLREMSFETMLEL